MAESLLPPVTIEITGKAAGALRSISQVIDRLAKLSEAAKAAAASFDESMVAMGDAAAKMSETAARSATVASDSTAKVGLASKEAAAGMRTTAAESAVAGAEMERSAGKAEGLGSKLLGLGPVFEKVTKWGSIGLAGVGIASVDLATKFQTQMTRLSTAAGAPIAQVQAMRNEVLQTATSVGVSGTQMAEALYHPVSAGLDLKTSLQAVRYAAMEAQISGASLDDTTYSLSSVMKAFNQSASSAGPTMASLNAIVGEGDMRFQDFNESVKNWAPTAAQMGISINSMGAGLAYLTDRGNSAEVAATRLTMGISMMTTPSGQAAKMLVGMGVASTDVTASSKAMQDAMEKAHITQNQLALDLQKPDGLYVALTHLKTALHNAGVSGTEADSVLAKIFGGGRSDKAIMSLMQNLDGLKGKFEDIQHASNMQNFQDAWVKTTHTLKYQFDQIKAAAENLGIRIGDALIPKVTSFISLLEQRGAPVVHSLSQALSGIASGFSGRAGRAPASPVLQGRAARMQEGAGEDVPAPPLTGWQRVGQVFKQVADDLAKFGREAAAAFGNLTKAAGPTLQLLGGALLVVLRQVADILANVVGPALVKVTAFMDRHKTAVRDLIAVALIPLAIRLAALSVIKPVGAIAGLAKDVVMFPINQTRAIFDGIKTGIGAAQKAAEGARAIWGGLRFGAVTAAQGIKDAFGKIPWDSMTSGAGKLWDGLGNGALRAQLAVSDFAGKASSALQDGLVKAAQVAGQAWRGAQDLLVAGAGKAGVAWRAIQSGASTAADAIADFGSKAGAAVASAASSAWDGIVGGLQAVGGAAKSAALGLVDLGEKAMASALAAARSAAAWVAEKVSLVASAVAEKAAAAAEWALNIAMDATPIMLVVLAVAALVGALIYAYNHSRTFREIVQAAFQATAAAAMWLWHSVFEPVFKAIGTILGACVDWVKSHWPLLLGLLTGPIGMAVVLVIKYWSDIKRWFADGINAVFAAAGWLARLPGMVWGWMSGMASAVGRGIMSVVHWFEGLPGQIWSIASSIASDMVNAGVNIMIGLYNGLVSMGSWLYSQVIGLIKAVIPGPILHILGISSPSKWAHWAGQMVGHGLANGILSTQSVVANATRQLAGTVTGGLATGVPALSVAGAAGSPSTAYTVPAGPSGISLSASAAAAPLGGATVVNNITVQGSVVSERHLRDVVQTQMLQLGARNSQTYQAYRR